MKPGPEEAEASVSQPVKPELWRTVTEPSKVIEAYYSEGNFYHADYIVELSTLAQTSHKNVRDTLSRLRKKDEKAGKFVPAAPRQQYEFSDVQRQVLEEAFSGEFAYPKQVTTDDTRELARVTGLTVKQVNNWFCNQRRKQDGRSLEKDKKRRERIREDRISKGLARVSVFTPSHTELFEEYHLKCKAAAAEGRKFKVPYGDLVEKTGQDRKKIRDWFSKRKLRPKKGARGTENEVANRKKLEKTDKNREHEEEEGRSEEDEETSSEIGSANDTTGQEDRDESTTPKDDQPVYGSRETLISLLENLVGNGSG